MQEMKEKKTWSNHSYDYIELKKSAFAVWYDFL